MCTNTGAWHIFHVEPSQSQHLGYLKLKSQPGFASPFWRRIVEGYIDYAFQKVGKIRETAFNRLPSAEIDVLGQFWSEYYGMQDTLLICLELYQRWFFDD
jgi:hypothetical protein